MKIELQNNINNYLYNSCLLCIILGNENFYPWFYENYTQIFYNDNKWSRYSNKEVWLDFYGGWIAAQSLLEFIKIPRKSIANIDIITYIKDKIDNHKYVFTFLDEYYVKPNYMKSNSHRVHDILVYGYDDFSEKLTVIGFDNNHNFTSYNISYQTFAKAFENGLALTESEEIWNQDNLYGRLFKFREKNSQFFKFNIKKFLRGLHDYIFSINSAQKDFPDRTADKEIEYFDIYFDEKNIFGMEIYEHLPEYLYNVIKYDTRLSYVPFHTLFEHKKGMKDRLIYIAKNFKVDDKFEELIDRYNHTVNVFNSMRLAAMKYIIDSKESIIKNLINTINIEKIYEKEILAQVYEEICNLTEYY
ncbi:hypothetical protein [Acetivibrio straminisolvens]|uniref:hypothetical protein n=1 Tax=Acetivibrio straminisolvens TaxID=253314 RepID=UPI0012FEB8EB|nr:hypothetical protein [Acetivibrio straminisolvens]